MATSGMFRAAFAKRRCIVPAAAFYEWRTDPEGKSPFAIARTDGLPLAFAGLWEGWKAPDESILRTFTIVTTNANKQMAALHDRMPIILEQSDWPLWLGEAEGDPATLLRPSPENVLRIWPVDRRVNNVRHDGPDLLEPKVPPDHANPAPDLLNPS